MVINKRCPERRSPVISRFWSKVKVSENTGCWGWSGAKNKGYGKFWGGNRPVYAHRWLYEQINGAVPEGFELDHLCRNRSCVNPAHLEVVTRKENCLRGDGGLHLKLKTHCPQGHPYNDENTYIYTTANGTRGRYCRTCRYEGNKKRRRRNE